MQDKKNTDSSGSGGSAVSVFKLLDKAAEFGWSLRFAGAFLFADAAMVAANKKDFMHWDWSAGASAAHIGLAISAFLAYSLCVSLVIPTVNGLFQSVIWMLPVLRFWISGGSRYGRPNGCVTDTELQDRADQEQSSYLQSKLDRAKDERRESAASISELGRISLTTLVFFVTNVFVVDSDVVHTATGLFLSAFDSDLRHALEWLVIGVLVLPAWFAWTYDPGLHWIRYRPLYDEIIAKQNERK